MHLNNHLIIWKRWRCGTPQSKLSRNYIFSSTLQPSHFLSSSSYCLLILLGCYLVLLCQQHIMFVLKLCCSILPSLERTLLKLSTIDSFVILTLDYFFSSLERCLYFQKAKMLKHFLVWVNENKTLLTKDLT